MLSSLALLGFGFSLANALAIRGGCELHITAGGAAVGQISSGQVRAGDGISSAAFTLNGDSLTDSKGRGCWWTPPTKILQCDQGQNPAHGFHVACDGTVSFNGQTTFYECEAEGGKQVDISLTPSGSNCKKVGLKADGCKPSNCNKPPPEESCPTNLDGTYEFPHLIIPVDKSKPNSAPGTSYFGEVSSSISSIFNFDIPASDEGKKCSLVFLFPKQEDLETSSYTFSGNGGLHFEWLKEAATEGTTYNNQPGVKEDLGSKTVAPGNSYSVATFDCPAGQAIAFEIMAEGNTKLRYFQDYNPSPIGLYITVC